MCGFFAEYFFDKNNLSKLQDKSYFDKYLKNRGPDESNFVSSNGFNCCHYLLKIRNQSIQRQPIETDRNCFVYNGELYNKESHEEGDTNFLFNIFDKNIFHETILDGIFSAVYYNKIDHSVEIARDRFGVKPLFYQLTNTSIRFSSSLRLLVNLNEDKLELDKEACREYLKYGFFLHNKTPYTSIRKAEKGKVSKFKFNNGNLSCEFLDLKYCKVKDDTNTNIINAVHSQLVSDVPLSVLLSGGVDSSIVAATTNIKIRNLNSYSLYACDEFHLDEKDEIEKTSNLLNLNSKIIKFKNPYKYLDKSIKSLDIPVNDSSIILNYKIYEKIHKDRVPVALTGIGADELFGGYKRYKIPHYANKYKHLFKFLIFSINILFRLLRVKPKNKLMRWLSSNSPNNYLNLFCIEPSINCSLDEIDMRKIEDIQRFELQEYLSNCLLSFTDSISMHHSIEARVPFLSNIIVGDIICANQNWSHDKKFLIQIKNTILSSKKKSIKRGFSYSYDSFMVSDKSFRSLENYGLLSIDELDIFRNNKKFAFGVYVLDRWLDEFSI